MELNSQISWLDYSEYERRKTLDMIDLFREKGTRDELGIGLIRDALANLLFPGTSTVQTRARYFLFIPWMYGDLENRRISSRKIRDRARQYEVNLITTLLKSDDTDGVIGKVARHTLQRLPSNIYWQGLGVLGIHEFPGSWGQYHRSLDAFYLGNRLKLIDDDKEYVDDGPIVNWHAGLPDPPKDFPAVATLILRKDEAIYLCERIRTKKPDSLLAHLVEYQELTNGIHFPWEHPYVEQFPKVLREYLEHAHNFSLMLQGAALLYNFMLADLIDNQTLLDEYRENLDLWSAQMHARNRRFQHWDIQRFWEIVEHETSRIPRPTKRFVEGWLALAIEPKARSSISTNPGALNLIKRRERSLKGEKMSRIENDRARDTWTGASGTGRMNYRWGITQQILADIFDGIIHGE